MRERYSEEQTAFIKTRVRYDPESGDFFHIYQDPKRPTMKRAGFMMGDGYLHLSFSGVNYLAHRVAWLFVHRDWPWNMEVDHIDGNVLNNSAGNLRLATRSENRVNSGKPRNNTSGFKGVTWCKRRKKYRAAISKNYKFHDLGYFDDPAEAGRAYEEAARKIHGEFHRKDDEIKQ